MPAHTISASGEANKKKSLRLSMRARSGAAHSSFVTRHIKRAHAMADSPLEELSIAMVGDQQMSDLHRRFMSIASPTDVLTFPLETDGRGRTISGELVLCVPEARRRAKEHDVPVAHELLLYAIHGMLHLSGYDDRTGRGYKIMHDAEDDLLCRLGIGPVFRPECGGANRSSSHKSVGKSRKQRRVR